MLILSGVQIYCLDVENILKDREKIDNESYAFFSYNSYVEFQSLIRTSEFNKYKTLFILIQRKISREQVVNLVDLLYEKKINSILVTSDDKENFKLQEKMCKTIVIKENESLSYSLKKIFIVINRDLAKIVSEEKEVSMRLTPLGTDKKHPKIIGIGASSGGTETAPKIYSKFPAKTPPMLMVQHMPKVFSKLFTERLNKECAFNVVEAIDGEIVRDNTLYVAPGGYQMSIVDGGNYYKIRIQDIGLVSNHCPSVNYLFDSMAKVLKNKCVAVILTGMGEDGATGMCNIKASGGFTIGQNKASSIVYGMPRAAFEKGGVCLQLSDVEIANYLIGHYFSK